MVDVSGAFKKLKERQAKNKVLYPWQDAALAIIETLNLPNYVKSDKFKEPLNVRSIIMKHAKQNLPVLQRRMALVHEHGKSGAEAFVYYLGIVESESKNG